MDMDVTYPSSCYPARFAGGLTLIELLMGLAVATLLLGMAVPSFSGIIQNSRMTGHLNTLIRHLHYARSEAIKSGFNVIVCKSQDGNTCTKSSEWTEGWIVFRDKDNSRQREITEPLLSVQQALGHEFGLSYRGFRTSNYILYYPIGTVLGNGTFTFCDKRGEENARALVLSKMGRLRTSRAMPDGSQLRCPSG